ncbi:hypothetical protein [Fibrobacter sp.]|uniref:hypothetical protein n=1 Tax=Fibrobacter sp. TaxID=35828 RepID=UPI0025BF4153|nr:hypothetical protein [Fibrobacter sp.]MBR3071672.1 hypothetical protein [Fibrobacter sp.]
MIPDWKLERFLTGDLPDEEMNMLRELEVTDVVFANRVKMLREDNKAILNKLPFKTLAGKLADVPETADVLETANVADSAQHANAARIAPRFTLMKFAAAAMFIFAVALVAFMAQRETVVAGGNAAGNGDDVAAVDGSQITQVAFAETQSDTRIKGLDARMEVWKKTDAGIVQLQDLDEVREGDEIQLRYAVPEKCFGLLFSMDGNGALTLHMGDGVKAIELTPGKMNSLPFAYKLDDAPYFEKFFFVTSPKEFAVEENDVDKLLKRSDVKVIGFTLKKAGK